MVILASRHLINKKAAEAIDSLRDDVAGRQLRANVMPLTTEISAGYPHCVATEQYHRNYFRQREDKTDSNFLPVLNRRAKSVPTTNCMHQNQ